MSITKSSTSSKVSPSVVPCKAHGCHSRECQVACIEVHQVDYCSFWGMVYSFPYKPAPPGLDCSAGQDPNQYIPQGLAKTSGEIQALLNSADCTSQAVYMAYPNNPIDYTTNSDIIVNTRPYSILQIKGEYSQSISLFQGLVNQYPNGTFYFYKAMVTVEIDGELHTLFNATFYVSDGLQENYYCDVSGLFP